MKKLLCLVLVVCMVLPMALACTAEPAVSTQPAPVANETAPAVVQEPIKTNTDTKSITLMASQNWIKDVDRELFKQFQEESGIEVKILLTPDNGYTTLLGTSLSGGSNAIDMFMYPAGGEMKSAGIPEIALDLTGSDWGSRLEEWAKTANTVDGKLLGFSTWGVDFEGVLYNKTFFEENSLKVPTTWDEFLALCDAIKALGVTPLYEGINGVWHTQSWVYALTPVIATEKPDYVEYLNAGKQNNWKDIAALRNGLEQIKGLFEAKEGGKPKYFTNDGQAEDWFGSYPALQNRECAMMFTYSAYAAELAANGATDTFGMFPCPLLDNQTAVSNGGGISKYINKNSSNIEACKLFLDFLARDENLETYYGARTDLVSAAFKDVESVSATTATNDILTRTAKTPPVMLIKDVLYWDSDVYKYLQGFAAGTETVDQFITSIDEYRATMFDTAE